MNLAKIDNDTRQRLLRREDCIGFFVFQGKYHWVVAWEAFFNLDQKKNFDAARNAKFKPMSKEEHSDAMRDFRGGIPTLTEDLFPNYRDSELAKVVTTEMLREEFFIEDKGQYSQLSTSIEQSLSFDAAANEDLIQLRMRLSSKLPKFYINYDRKIFMHMVRGRFYDKVVLDGWWGAECDFEHMIPTSYRYWMRDPHEDFWAITNFSNS